MLKVKKYTPGKDKDLLIHSYTEDESGDFTHGLVGVYVLCDFVACSYEYTFVYSP